MVSDGYASQYLSAGPDLDMASDHRLSTTSAANGHLLEEQTIDPDNAARVDNHSIRVRKQ
jgi:hypothetical protein